MSVTYGLDPKAQRISVYYTETSTIYEGMPVCYEFDATTNWLGVDGSKIDFTTTASTASLESTSTAEGYQNEGKFIRVEDPDADNIHAFAGVVAGGDHVGQAGPRAIDIYVPNGAIVPVRTDQACTCGTTVLAVHTAEQHLTGPYSTAGRPVALAAETKDNSSAAAIVLAKLDPNLFLYQMADATNLNIDDQDTGNDMVLNKIKVSTAQTSGIFSALWIQTTLAGAGISQTGYASCLYCEQDIAVAVGGQTPCAAFWTNLTGGTQTEPIFGAQVAIYEDGATLTSSNIISILTLTSQFADNPQANSHCWLHLENNGTYPPDCLIRAGAIADLGAAALSGDVTFSSSGIKIPIYISGSSTTYYLAAQPSI